MGGKRWTPEEDDALADLWGTCSPREAGKRLGRTEASIHVRAGKLGLGRSTPPGSLTAREFQQVIGMDSWVTFRHWATTGILVATRNTLHGAKRPDWIVTEHAVITFLRTHPHLIDRDGVDPAYRQFVPERWITLVQAFRLGAAYPTLLEHGVKAGLIPEARQRGEKGTRWAIPASILPRLVEGRRRFTPDPGHRRLVVAYDRARRNGNIAHSRRRLIAKARGTSAGGRSGRVAA